MCKKGQKGKKFRMQRGNRDLKKFNVAGAQNAGRKWQELEKQTDSG